MEVGKRFNPYNLFHGCYVPEWLARRREISQGAKLLYGRLIRYAGKNGQCNPKIETISDEVGVSRRMAVDYINELRNHGLIDTSRTGKGKANDYFFVFHQWITEGDKVKDASLDKVKDASLDKGKNASLAYKDKRESFKESHLNKKHARVNGCPVPDSLQQPQIVEAYQLYCNYMKENWHRWPTSTTTQMDLAKLQELQASGNDPVKVIQQTIHGRNKSFFELRNFQKNGDAAEQLTGKKYQEL